MEELERWRDIHGFPDYQVSNLGRVMRGDRIIKPSGNGKGTLRINLRSENGNSTRGLAHLVCRAFHGVPQPDHDSVVYLDGDMMNVNESNLKWDTRSFAWEWTHQINRTEPLRRHQVHKIKTGEIFENALVAAKAVIGIEKYIVICCGDSATRFYRGSNWEWHFD